MTRLLSRRDVLKGAGSLAAAVAASASSSAAGGFWPRGIPPGNSTWRPSAAAGGACTWRASGLI